jgi:menaquinone reductase, multiheme cytochrome c subunit
MSSNDDSKIDGTENDDHASSPNFKNTLPFIILFFIVGLAASMVLGWLIFPKLLYSQKRQPIDFNHRMHLELVDQSCQSCHFFREDGTFSGAPKLEQCTDCHYTKLGMSENEALFFDQYVSRGREVPWLVYARQPDCVFFSHAAHVEGAKMDCITCHGHTGTSTSLRPYEENRITGISRDIWGRNIAGLKRNSWDRMKMSDCADCHAQYADIHDSSVQTQRDACFVCHK